MKTLIKRLGFLTLTLAMALSLTACEEALTDSNDEGIPPIEGDGTPFVEFVSPEDPTAAPGGAVELVIEPGEAIGQPITVQYDASGPALGAVAPTDRVEIPFNSDDTDLEDATITVTIAAGAASGETVTVELTSASSEDGAVDVGRGGTEIDRSRTITVQ